MYLNIRTGFKETQMTTDDRLAAIEETQAKIVEVQDGTLTLLERVVELIEETKELTEETRRESQQTRRIWIAFAKHHGWPEDLGNLDDDHQPSL